MKVELSFSNLSQKYTNANIKKWEKNQFAWEFFQPCVWYLDKPSLN